MQRNRLLLLFGLLLSAGVASFAQDAPVVKKGTFELGVFPGASYGFESFRPMVGGNLAYSATKVIMPYFEFSYFPGLPRQDAFNREFKLDLADFHGGVHLRVPIPDSRFVPYAAFGVGGIHSFATTVRDVPPRPDVPFPARTDFAVNFGGGLRYYITERWGFRIEFKAYKPTQGPVQDVFVKAVGGFFVQF